MSNIPVLFVALIGWGMFIWAVKSEPVPVVNSNCADLEFERDSLKIKNNQWRAIMDSIN